MEIPKAKTRQPFSGLHGERAEIMKRTYKVNVDITAGQHVPKRAKKVRVAVILSVKLDLGYTGNAWLIMVQSIMMTWCWKTHLILILHLLQLVPLRKRS